MLCFIRHVHFGLLLITFVLFLKQLLRPAEINRWVVVNFSAKCDTEHIVIQLVGCGRRLGIVRLTAFLDSTNVGSFTCPMILLFLFISEIWMATFSNKGSCTTRRSWPCKTSWGDVWSDYVQVSWSSWVSPLCVAREEKLSNIWYWNPALVFSEW